MFGYFWLLDQYLVERCSGAVVGLWTGNPEVRGSRLGRVSNNFPKIVVMCEEGGRSAKMFEGKCKGEINSFILFS